MKRKNKKLITLILAGAMCATMVGGFVAHSSVRSTAAETTYALSEIFAETKGDADDETDVIGAEKRGDATTETAAFTLADGDSVWYKNDLAFKWFKAKNDPQYLTMKFALKDLNFKSLTFTVESDSSVASEDEKAINSVKLVNDNGVKAYVVNGKTDGVKDEDKKDVPLAAGDDVTIALKEGTEYGEFKVELNGTDIGSFKNVGSNYANYSYEETYPLTIEAKCDGTNKTVVYLNEINGQKFDNITTKEGVDGASGKLVKDTAAPVLVVNEELNGFSLGSAFSLSYEKIDVLQTSSLVETKKYYQYDPTDSATDFVTLSTSTYFMDTVYYTNGTEVSAEAKEGYKATSVYAMDAKEYVAVEFTLADNAFNADEGDWTKAKFDLSWYATRSTEKTVGENTRDYLILDRNDSGAYYSYITANDTDSKNDVDAALDGQVEIFQAELEKAAEDVYAGSNSYIYFPSFEWLFNDDNGYRNLKFTISYKTASSTSAKTSSGLSASGLKLSASEEGLYEFKIFATDKEGNPMQYYLDDEKVAVTTSNIWDIDAIPSFSYSIQNRGLKVEDKTNASSRRDTKILYETYTFSDATVIGATNKKSDYALYKLDLNAYNDTLDANEKQITRTVLSGITYEKLQKALEGKIVGADDYFKLYIDAYAGLIADAVNGDKAAVLKCFENKIEKYNERITEDDAEYEAYNKYEWQKSSNSSFMTAEEGEYLIVADYWEEELPMQRAMAYKLVIVESEADVIKGETQWLKNNVVSVVLFSIAGVMLVLIIILLLIKPSDETLEDVDAKVEEKKNKKKEK
ncbi:MAG: hypothetical protein IJZ32_06070 [Clostridia bacterium]|nr:hypothetical protein [Clostridia bacterium]